MYVHVIAGRRSTQRVIILNGEIKGLQSSPVIQLSISRLISTQRRGMREILRHSEHRKREVMMSEVTV